MICVRTLFETQLVFIQCLRKNYVYVFKYAMINHVKTLICVLFIIIFPSLWPFKIKRLRQIEKSRTVNINFYEVYITRGNQIQGTKIIFSVH